MLNTEVNRNLWDRFACSYDFLAQVGGYRAQRRGVVRLRGEETADVVPRQRLAVDGRRGESGGNPGVESGESAGESGGIRVESRVGCRFG